MIKQILQYAKRKILGTITIEDLQRRGLSVGNNCYIYDVSKFDYRFCWLISIGNRVTITPNVTILTHDASTSYHLGATKIGRVDIGDYTFIGTGSIILPNIKIGSNVIVGAGSVVTRDIPNNMVVAGNPAKIICTTSEYIEKQRVLLEERPKYDQVKYFSGVVDKETREKIINELKNEIGYSTY